ncbi:MAG: histidine phosphatase family protein [Actinomycetales bacterium]
MAHMPAATIIIWRHGRTEWNLAGRFQGHTDIPLDQTGLRQAELAAKVLAGFGPTAIVTSDLGRARQTAAPLEAMTGLVATVDSRLRESAGGTWEGRLLAEIGDSDPEGLAGWLAGGDVPAEGAETRAQVADRAAAAVTDAVAGTEDDGVLVVVTHGGTARSLTATLLGLPREHWGVLGGLSNCCWSVLERRHPDLIAGTARYRLIEHNAGQLPEPVLGDDR